MKLKEKSACLLYSVGDGKTAGGPACPPLSEVPQKRLHNAVALKSRFTLFFVPLITMGTRYLSNAASAATGRHRPTRCEASWQRGTRVTGYRRAFSRRSLRIRRQPQCGGGAPQGVGEAFWSPRGR